MSNELTHGIKFKDKIGYALGDMGGILSFSLISAFLQMFYTDSLHIPLGKITVLMLIARIWDAVNDPIWGAFIDSRKPTKFGRFRPYIFWLSFPLAFSSVLMFTKIPGLTELQYLIFAYVTYIIYGMMYTGVNIPYGSLASVITDDEIERSSLSMWRSIGAGLGGLPAQILLPLFVFSTVVGEKGEEIKVLDSTKLSVAVLCLAALSIIIFSMHFKLTKERVTIPVHKERNYNALSAIYDLLKNKPFVVLCFVSMFFISYQMYTQTTYNYLLKDFYQKPGLYSIVTICTYLPMAFFLPFIAKLIRKFGKKEICAFGIAFSAGINSLMFLLRFTSLVHNPYIFLVLVFLSGSGQTFLVLEIWALVMDVTDYHEYLTHRREEGTSYALYSFVRKLGQTLAGAGSSALLGIIGYDVAKTSLGQDEAVISKLYDITTIVPAIMLLIIFILLAFCYKLSKSKLNEMHNELYEIRENER